MYRYCKYVLHMLYYWYAYGLTFTCVIECEIAAQDVGIGIESSLPGSISSSGLVIWNACDTMEASILE